jgi:uncharacterized membrane protein (UPF0136 family)
MSGPSTPTAHWIALAIIAVYGIVSIAGGILGYVLADSKASLVAGGIAGLLLLLCAGGVFYLPAAGLSGAIVIAVALLGRFAPSLYRQSSTPEGLGTTKGIVALIMVAGGVLVIAFSAWGLATRSNPPGAP